MSELTQAFDFSGRSQLTIGVLSDTHGELNDEIAQLITQCDIALHAGDIMAAEPLNRLKPKLGVVIAVKGNNDLAQVWGPEDSAVLSSIPDTAMIRVAGGLIVMEHAHRVWHPEISQMHTALRRDHPQAKLVVYGHTHIRTIDQSATPWLINPGAAGCVRVQDGPSCMVIKINGGAWQIDEHVFAPTAKSIPVCA